MVNIVRETSNQSSLSAGLQELLQLRNRSLSRCNGLSRPVKLLHDRVVGGTFCDFHVFLSHLWSDGAGLAGIAENRPS